MVIGSMKENTFQSPTGAAGYTSATCCTGSVYTALEYQTVSAAGSYTPSFTLGGNDAWAEIGDAIRGATANPTPNPFQVKIVFNPSAYSTYEASNLGNIRFCVDSACTTTLYAWLESCTPSCAPTATSATAWVKLTSAIAGNGGTYTIYMEFYPLSTQFDGVFWGEAPNLSGTYGQYDNGANVFTFYDNFAGTSLSLKWTTVISSGGSVTVNNGATFATSASTDYAFVVSATQTYPLVSESYMVSQSASGVKAMLGVSTTASTNPSNALYAGYDLDFYSGSDKVNVNVAGSRTTLQTITQASFPAGIWTVIWSAGGSEYFQDGAGNSYTGTDNSAGSIANYRIFVGQSNNAAGNNVVRWGRMRALPPNSVLPSTAFGSIAGGGIGGATTLYNGYNLNWKGGVDSYDVSTISSMTVLSTQVQATFPAGIWQVTWPATGSEYFQDGAGLSYTGSDSSISIANYGIYLGQTNAAAGSNVVQWARMRAFPPNNVMPSVSFGSITAGTNGNVVFSVVFTDTDPQGRGVTLWPDSSVTAITTVTGGQSQSNVVSFYVVDGLALNSNGYPINIVAYNSTHSFIRLPYRVPTTVYFGATTPKGSSMNTISVPTDPLQVLFTLTGQMDDKSLYGQTIPFPTGIATTASATLSVYSGGASTSVTVSGSNLLASTKGIVGWIDPTGKVTTVATFTTSSSGTFSGVSFQVPSASAGYYTIVVSDYINSAFITFQHL
jgi:hypothetical protein